MSRCPFEYSLLHTGTKLTRYDLNALFLKAYGDFSVNVQGLSRVGPLQRAGSQYLILSSQGMFPLKAFYWGQKGARDNYTLQISNLANEAYRSIGEKPVIIGECGIPMDLKYVSFLVRMRDSK